MPRGKAPKSLALIEACRAILQDIQPASVRATCYQLFMRQLLASMAKSNTDRISAQLTDARKLGLVPWEWFVDETREADEPGTWNDPDHFIPAVMASYRRDRWRLQGRRVEVWSEKGTVGGTLRPVTRALGVRFEVWHGYNSTTKVHEVAEACKRDPRPLTVFYVGDFDPSGMDMSDHDLPRRLVEHGVTVTIQRLAITRAYAEAQGLPSFPATDKRADSRYKGFQALSPVNLR